MATHVDELIGAMAATRQHVVRVTERTHRALRERAEQTGSSTPAIIEQAIERYQREHIVGLANARWAAIMADPATRAELEGEDAFWDRLAGDGLPVDEWRLRRVATTGG
jgi:hypothetical protein